MKKMKKMNYRDLIKASNWLLAGLMTLLGFTSCEKTLEEYGTPWETYAIKGAVVNKTDGKPIKGIKVNVVPYDDLSVLTDEKGEFKFSDTSGQEGSLAFTDIDGEANGLFVSDTVKVDYDNAEHIGGGDGWFQGELTAIVKAELTEQK